MGSTPDLQRTGIDWTYCSPKTAKQY